MIYPLFEKSTFWKKVEQKSFENPLLIPLFGKVKQNILSIFIKYANV